MTNPTQHLKPKSEEDLKKEHYMEFFFLKCRPLSAGLGSYREDYGYLNLTPTSQILFYFWSQRKESGSSNKVKLRNQKV